MKIVISLLILFAACNGGVCGGVVWDYKFYFTFVFVYFITIVN